MSLYATVVVAAAIVCSLILSGMRARRDDAWSRFLLEAIGLLLFVAVLRWLFGFPMPSGNAVPKGPADDFALGAALFVAMLFGMLGQVLYRHFSVPASLRRRRRIDWGRFLAPVCASPIVFMPLMVSLQNANIDLQALTAPRMMIFLVAFQNGFFWKEHFDRQYLEAKKGAVA